MPLAKALRAARGAAAGRVARRAQELRPHDLVMAPEPPLGKSPQLKRGNISTTGSGAKVRGGHALEGARRPHILTFPARAVRRSPRRVRLVRRPRAQRAAWRRRRHR